MKHHLGAGLAILALAAALSGCGSSTGTTPAATSPGAAGTSGSSAASSAAASSTASAAVDLKTASSSVGSIVVDAKGMSLYFFTKDTKDSGTSACTGSCLVQWPPLTTASGSPAAEGVTGKLGTISTPDGKKQVTLNGMPLYYFAKDAKPGDILGQGVGGVWYLSDPSGAMIKAANQAY
ncbi:COG4315 family predicted lipoprotein [Pseudarthrobacter phenanthrenivorans]|uniref:COG4315 family predicted lipoprotein n=1 Tax=Pseudarthrobacter phenanthrenivorans TaxID=361575 RepID=UPI002F35E99E